MSGFESGINFGSRINLELILCTINMCILIYSTYVFVNAYVFMHACIFDVSVDNAHVYVQFMNF